MKKLVVILVFAVSTALVFNACSGSSKSGTEQTVKKEYTCPMHPEVISDKPGKCPKCGMELVEKVSGNKQDTLKK